MLELYLIRSGREKNRNPLPGQAGQPGLHSPHQPQQPYRQLGPAQGQPEPALAQSQQSTRRMQQPIRPTYQSQSQLQVPQLSNQLEGSFSSHGLSQDQHLHESENRECDMDLEFSVSSQLAEVQSEATGTAGEDTSIALFHLVPPASFSNCNQRKAQCCRCGPAAPSSA